jgi:NADPH:quinone reductase-like Zn-dependent oxidoreductase
MSIQSNGFRGIEGAAKQVPIEISQELGPKEILLKITHSSICGTDVHLLTTGAALGHEGVGIVEKIGSEVTQFKVGDRAGAGYVRNASSSLAEFAEINPADFGCLELWYLQVLSSWRRCVLLQT